MNAQKFTQKSIDAVKNAQSIAIDNQNSQIEQEHLLYALLIQDDSLIKQLFKRMNTNDTFIESLEKEIKNKPKISGSGATTLDQIYVSRDTNEALSAAEKEANRMKDDYISVEHIMIGLFDRANYKLKELFNTYNISKDAFLKVFCICSLQRKKEFFNSCQTCSHAHAGA